MNVLVSSVSRKVSLVQAWAKAAHRTGGKVITADMNLECPGMFFGDERGRLPALDADDFMPKLYDICKKHDVQVVVPTRDDEILELSLKKAELSDLGIRILCPSFDTVRLCQDKIKFAIWLKENGFGVAEIYSRWKSDANFPAFVRFRRGNGSTLARKVNDAMECASLTAEWGKDDCLVQEYIKAPEYSVDVFSDQYGKAVCVVPRRRIQVIGGESYVSKTVDDAWISREAVRLSEKLHLTGHSVLQCFIARDSDIYWIEANPRFGGASALSLEAGCRSPEWVCDEVDGRSLPDPLVKYDVGLTMLRYTQDLFVRSQ